MRLSEPGGEKRATRCFVVDAGGEGVLVPPLVVGNLLERGQRGRGGGDVVSSRLSKNCPNHSQTTNTPRDRIGRLCLFADVRGLDTQKVRPELSHARYLYPVRAPLFRDLVCQLLPAGADPINQKQPIHVAPSCMLRRSWPIRRA